MRRCGPWSRSLSRSLRWSTALLDLWLYPAHRARSLSHLTVSLRFLTLATSLLEITQSLAAILSSTSHVTNRCTSRCLTTVIRSLHTRGQLRATGLISLAMSVHSFTDRSGKGAHAITFTVCHSARCSCIDLTLGVCPVRRFRQSTTSIHFASKLAIRCRCRQSSGRA